MLPPVSSATPEVSIGNRDAVFLQVAGLTEVMMPCRFAATIHQNRGRGEIHSALHLLSFVISIFSPTKACSHV